MITQQLSQLEAVDTLSHVDTAALRLSVETKIKEWARWPGVIRGRRGRS